MKTITLIILLLAISNPNAKQKFYKWTDADGNTHYSENKPADKSTSEIEVNTNHPKPTIATTEQTEEDSSGEQLTEEQQAVEDYNKNEKEKVMKAQNKANCNIARKNLSTLQQTVRISKKDPTTGEIIRMDDSQRVNMMKTAKKSIQTLCN